MVQHLIIYVKILYVRIDDGVNEKAVLTFQ